MQKTADLESKLGTTCEQLSLVFLELSQRVESKPGRRVAAMSSMSARARAPASLRSGHHKTIKQEQREAKRHKKQTTRIGEAEKVKSRQGPEGLMLFALGRDT